MERTRAADRFKQLEHDVEEYQSKSHHRHLSHQQQETTLERDKEGKDIDIQVFLSFITFILPFVIF